MRSPDRAPRRYPFVLLAALLATACTRQTATPRAAAQPEVLTVPKLSRMAEMGTQPSVIIGEIQRTGTVYRLTPQQAQDLKSSGIPPGIMSFIDLGYTNAIEKNPDLAKSDAQWHQIDGYWYGGTPFGWPREWVVGAPAFGEKLRR